MHDVLSLSLSLLCVSLHKPAQPAQPRQHPQEHSKGLCSALSALDPTAQPPCSPCHLSGNESGRLVPAGPAALAGEGGGNDLHHVQHRVGFHEQAQPRQQQQQPGGDGCRWGIRLGHLLLVR